MSRSAAVMVLLPRLTAFAEAYPDIVLDVVTATLLTSLRVSSMPVFYSGQYIQKDMIAVRVTQELRLAVVGSPGYFSSRSIPRKPKDLNDHRCISLRLPGGPYRWEFEKGRKAVTVGVNGPLIIDDTHLVIQAALAGAGLGLAFEEQVAEHVAKRRLIRGAAEYLDAANSRLLHVLPQSSASAGCAVCIDERAASLLTTIRRDELYGGTVAEIGIRERHQGPRGSRCSSRQSVERSTPGCPEATQTRPPMATTTVVLF